MNQGKPYINIGTEKSCLFVLISKRLINILEKNKLLYFAIEESLECASRGYYAAGILAYSQLFNCFGIKAPESRHKVAHEFLHHRPTAEIYDSMLFTIKYVAEVAYIKEADKFTGSREEFHKKLFTLWKESFKKIK